MSVHFEDLKNLLRNLKLRTFFAVKYTEKGTITVSLRAAGHELEVVVRDTGFGLSIVKHVMLLYGGTIGVRSSPGEGTAFTIRFPLTP